MLTVKGSKLDDLPISGLKRVRDLMWLDGPLLCEYVHPHGDRYLYCWSDCSDTATRWMVMRVAEQTILRLASGKIPLDFVITKACLDDFVYFVDVLSGKRKETEVRLCRVADVPMEYLPLKGVFLDEPEPADDGRYTVLLDGVWEPSDLFLLPKSFEQAYSFLHAHTQMQVPTLEKLPWKGGWSSLHFDSWVRKTIPQADRLGVDKVMLASPGFIRFAANDVTASYVAECVTSLSENASVHEVYRELTAFIGKQFPREREEDQSLSDLDVHAAALQRFTAQLARGIGVIDADRLQASVKRPYEAAQILRWFYRRLRPMVGFQKSGRLQFMTERSPD